MANAHDKPEPGENIFVHVVDYRANKSLLGMGVAFHWWDAGHTSLHRHNHYEFFIITSGHTLHTLNGKQETLEKGTLFLIRPRDVHQFAPAGPDKCIHINIAATAQAFGQLCGGLGLSPRQLAHSGNGSLSVSLPGGDIAFFTARARQLSYLSRDKGDETAIRLIICEMLVQAIAHVYKGRALPQDSRPAWLRSLLERLHTPEYMACSAGDVYRLAGYSAPVVIRHFKQYTGETVRSYLVRLKMDWAVQLLRTTDMTTLEVADLLGYASLSHFGKLFAKHTGACPREYRARHAKGQKQQGGAGQPE